MKFKDSITIFNRKRTNNIITYNKILIKKALWFDSVSSALIKQGIVDLNAKTIYVPYKQDYSKTYIQPEGYEREEDITNYFTINNGDYIGYGDISLNEDETVQMYKNRTGLLYEIKSVSRYTMGNNQHFEIIAD